MVGVAGGSYHLDMLSKAMGDIDSDIPRAVHNKPKNKVLFGHCDTSA
jgi:hypothetical protein